MSCRPPECGATCSSGARPPTGSTIGRTPSTSRRCTAARPKGTEPVAQPVAHPHGGDCTSLGTRLGGSGRLDTPRRVRPGHWARSHCLGFPSPPPPPSLTSPPPSHRLRPCRRYLLYNPHPTEEEQVAINAACLAVQLNLTASKLRCDRETEALALALALTTSPSPSPCLRLCPCPCPCPRPRPDPNPNPTLTPTPTLLLTKPMTVTLVPTLTLHLHLHLARTRRSRTRSMHCSCSLSTRRRSTEARRRTRSAAWPEWPEGSSYILCLGSSGNAGHLPLVLYGPRRPRACKWRPSGRQSRATAA